MRIINLMENLPGRSGCRAEHGLCFYVETKRHRLLVDAGPSDGLLENARRLGVDLARVDTVILSHGHYDHADGLIAFAERNPLARIYIRRGAEADYVAVDAPGAEPRYIGMDPRVKELRQVVWVEGDLRIDEELFLLGGVTGRRRQPRDNGRLMVRRDGTLSPDDFSHEQFLVLRQNGKRLLFTGCAHCSILNLMDTFRERCGGEPDVVIGGFHMMKRGRYEREEIGDILATARELARTKSRFYTCHCTGERACEIMKRVLGTRIRYVHCGEEIRVRSAERRSSMKWHRAFAWLTVFSFVMTMVTGYRHK